jgi:DNA polymerase-3 subunit epsilon
MLEKLQLEGPIAFIDVETTGKRPRSARIVELSILRVQPDGGEEYKSHRVNPEVPIPAEASAIHGITDADVAGEPAFRQYARSVSEFLDGCDVAGFNVVGFDLPVLEAEFKRAGVAFSRKGRQVVDSMVIFHEKERRDLKAAYLKYCGRELDNAHSAKEDAMASAEVLMGQLEMYADLPRDVPGLCAFCARGKGDYVDDEGRFVWAEGEAAFGFGPHEGRLLKEVASEDPGFLEWMLRRDFPPDVQDIVNNALRGEFPQAQ